MSDKQPIVAAAGFGLILADYWLGGSRETVQAGALTPNATTQATFGAHGALAKIGSELAFVLVATLLAGFSDAAASAMLALIVALAILWAIHHYSPTKASP